MIDFTNIENYKENNRIEAKKAMGGLPHSIWETYSAFANTLGGIILLGVEEYPDHTLHPVDLPDPDSMVAQFWKLVNDPRKASANILTPTDVSIERSDGKRIIAIRIPRAHRRDKPIYVEGNPFSGSYRRNGEGDYRCTSEEVQAMLRDAALRSGDMEPVIQIGLDSLDGESIADYRQKLTVIRPQHPWLAYPTKDFLTEIGAAQADGKGNLHPTVAGLLFFGKIGAIRSVFPHYHPYFHINSPHGGVIASIQRENLYRFYFSVSDALSSLASFSDCSSEEDRRTIENAWKEALVNCLTHADYHGESDVEIVCSPGAIVFTNPGRFPMDIETAKGGGISDPRNSALTKLFHLIGIGEGTGGGLASIFGVWNRMGWSAPSITERFDPDRITLTLPLGKEGLLARHLSHSKPFGSLPLQKQAIINHLTQAVTAKGKDIAALLGIGEADAEDLLSRMVNEGTLAKESGEDSNCYRLKA